MAKPTTAGILKKGKGKAKAKAKAKAAPKGAKLSKKKALGLRLQLGRRIKAGDKPAAIASDLSKKYGITPGAVSAMIDGMKANKKAAPKAKAKKGKPGRKPGRPAKAKAPKAAAKKRGRPAGSKNKAKVGRPSMKKRGRKPGRPAAVAIPTSGPIILDAKTAQIQIQAGNKRIAVASVIYQNEAALATSIRKALSSLA